MAQRRRRRKCQACGRDSRTVDKTETCIVCRTAGYTAQELKRTEHETDSSA